MSVQIQPQNPRVFDREYAHHRTNVPKGDFADRRAGLRQQTSSWVALMDLSGAELLCRQADNIGEGGLHLTAPVGHGLAVGQRYEICIGPESGVEAVRKPVGEGHYATVVRTQMSIGGHADHVKVGFRFDQPLVL